MFRHIPSSWRLVLGLALVSITLAAQPTDNPVATFYGAGNYPVWTDRIAWSRVIDMSTYTNGADDFARFENARDELHALGGGVLYYPAGTYTFNLPDTGYGPGIGTRSRGLMLKSGVVIRGATPATGADRAVVRPSEDITNPAFATQVTSTLSLGTTFVFPPQRRGKDPATGAANAAGQVPRDWSLIGMTPGHGETNVGEIDDVGVVHVKLDGGIVFFGFHTPRAATLDAGRWFNGAQFKDNWPAGAPLGDTWAKRVPDGTHYMDAIHGAENWHAPISAGSGRLIFGVISVNGTPLADMQRLHRTAGGASTPLDAMPPESFHSYRFTGRLTAHGRQVLVANNVLAKPTRNFVHLMVQGASGGGTPYVERLVLFDYSDSIGIDVNKSNYGGHQDHVSVTGPDSGYHYPDVILRDNWIFNRGNKGVDAAGKWFLLVNNHNERYHQSITFPHDYIVNAAAAYPSATPETGVNAGGISFSGWRWQPNETPDDYMSRGYDLGGRGIWADRNSVVNTGSRGNDGEGIMAQEHNRILTAGWAFTRNVQTNVSRGPGTSGEPGWIGIYDMDAIGFLSWKNWGPGKAGILIAAKKNRWVLDTAIGPNLGAGGAGTPLEVSYQDYQDIHEDPVTAPGGLAAVRVPGLGAQVTWYDQSFNEIGFRVERRLGAGAWKVIAYRPGANQGPLVKPNDPFVPTTGYTLLNPMTWFDAEAPAAGEVEYRVVAFNARDDDSTGVSLPVPLGGDQGIPVPLALGTAVGEAGVDILLESVFGLTYQLEVSDDLETWTPVGSPIPGDGTTKSFVGAAPGMDQERFYRVVVAR